MKKTILFLVVAGMIVTGGLFVNQNLDVAAEKEAASELAKMKDLETKTMEGFKKEDVVIGAGKEAVVGSQVIVHYRGSLADTLKEFESSYKTGKPIILTLGTGEVIKGWEMGLLGMKVGGKRRLTVPPALGYGATGRGDIIPPNATLLFDIELVEVR